MKIIEKLIFLMACIVVLSTVGCAFDIVKVKQTPANFTAAENHEKSFKLVKEVTVTLGTGYKRKIKAGTEWDYIGKISQGEVYKTDDQVLTIEGSNIFEADIVVSNSDLVGFYLPVEKTFSPLSSPIKLEIQKIKVK
jgi:hypothetical protein